MDPSVVRLRRWFAIAGAMVCLIVAGAYFHARHKVQNALKEVPQKLNIEIQQSAQAFTISKSEQGRTLFKLQASKAVQFKQGGRVDLHDVMITIYGRDSSRFDQIYGKVFEYDQPSGNVTSKGEVSIDLQANPQGLSNPDQTTPKELKNPLHLKTTDLVFNQKTGDAWTPSLIEFYVPQANGSAVGAKYDARDNILTLESRVRIVVSGAAPATILAQHAILEKNPREIVLQEPRTDSPRGNGHAEEATIFLRDDNTLERAVATGNVAIDSVQSKGAAKSGLTGSQVAAQKLEITVLPENQIQSAVFSGAVHLKTEGTQPSEASAGRAVLSFGKKNTVTRIHSEEQVRLVQHQAASGNGTAQDVQLTAPVVDLTVAGGNRLSRAETSGPPEISVLPSEGKGGPKTHVTADKFTAKFDPQGQLSQVHGEAHARMLTTAPPQDNVPQPERVSTSNTIDAYFRPGTGIETLVQQGQFAYTSGTQRAFADRARYTPADQILTLSGSPRIIDSGMATTAQSVQLNRATGEGFAEGDVKTTYNDLKAQPNGALLASSNPVHVTAERMAAHTSPAIAVYKGNARLWQDANVVKAPSMQFEKDQRMIVADSNAKERVSTALVSTDKSGKATPVNITADRLIYRDAERKAHFEGEVIAESTDVNVSAKQMDVFFSAANNSSTDGTPVPPQTLPAASRSLNGGSAKLDKIIASGSVVVTQPNRRATGEKLTYTAGDEKFVLTGGPPSIFDAEHGKITGVSLTLYRRDDRVVVDGSSSSPAVTETRVEH